MGTREVGGNRDYLCLLWDGETVFECMEGVRGSGVEGPDKELALALRSNQSGERGGGKGERGGVERADWELGSND